MPQPAIHADPAALGFDPAKLAMVPAAMGQVVANGDLAGIVTMVWRNGALAQFNAVGMRDREAGLPMARDTIFRIASMTKPITTAAALMLIDQGKMNLFDPITRWAPEFANMRVLKSPEGPLDDTYPAPRDITIEDLMTHRSGLAYAFTSKGPIAEAHRETLGDPFASPYSADEWIARLAKLPLTYAPGEAMHYSHATDLLGFIVGRATGMHFADALRQMIFEPLGMVDTGFHVPRDQQGRLAVVYQQNDDTGELMPQSFPLPDAPRNYVAGGGGLVSTADDYLRFARMLLGEGEVDGVRLLKPETVRLMRTNRLTPEQRARPFLGLPFWAASGFGLGLGVIEDEELNQARGAGSKGAYTWPGVFGGWWQADPAQNMILIYLIQSWYPLGPDLAAQIGAQKRLGGRIANPTFQKLAYAALAG